MKKISISETIKNASPNIKLGVISGNVKFEKNNKSLWQEIKFEEKRISDLKIETIKDIPQIASSREAYRALGKEPARYRLSAEALMRRIIKGKSLYQISNIVDVINLSSIKTGYSIGGYDLSNIQGDILFDIGKKDEDYEAIGRGKMNIESLPVFRDDIGAFGSPTSDSVRTMITDKTSKILLIVINFGGHKNFETDLQLISDLIIRYCSGEDVVFEIL
ncbi:MAG: hypothetical protein GXO49_08095 [Chlorobi bacterium]|nr:hypothetical protein [Chlorobiota bacterium]